MLGTFGSVVAVVAPILSVLIGLPQIVKLYQNRENRLALSGVSQLQYVLVLVNGILWLLLAYHTGVWTIGLPGLVNIPASLYALWLLKGVNDETIVTSKEVA